MKRGFWTGLATGVGAAVLAVTLVACQYDKTLTVPANSTASCSVITGPGGKK